MIIAILLAVSVALNFALARVLLRAMRRLIQFDEVFQGVLPVLEEYGEDLQKMSDGEVDGILADHPEVRAFHRRNVLARLAIESIVDSVRETRPERKEDPAAELPRPDME